MSPDETIFGTERILETVRANREKSAREIVDSLYAAVRQFAQNTPQLDDVTAVVINGLNTGITTLPSTDGASDSPQNSSTL